MNKKAYYYTIDAFLALVIIFSVLLLVNPLNKQTRELIYVQDDLIASLSELKISELNNSYADFLRGEGYIVRDVSVLEQLAEFYAKDMPEAELLAQSILDDLDLNDNVGIWFGNSLISIKNDTPYEDAKEIWVSRQFFSGIEKPNEGDVKGYSVRAFLRRNSTTDYFYFGGYVGDGDISVNLDSKGVIRHLELEIAINDDFVIYINDEFSGHYEKSPSSTTPARYNLDSYLGRLKKGSNLIEIRGENLFIAGGFLKVVSDNEYSQKEVYYLPGIDGLINIYDSFYVPGEINSMEVFLNFDSDYDLFMTIGNKTVFKNNSEFQNNFLIEDDYLSSLLDYSFLKRKTIPFRIGMENVSYISQIQKEISVFSVTDLSGSMNDCSDVYLCSYNCWLGGSKSCSTFRQCSTNPCGGTCFIASGHSTTCPDFPTLIDLAKEANKKFIDFILGNTNNHVGLIGYSTGIVSSSFHNLSNNNNSLKNKVDEWGASGGTCICCGIHDAMMKLKNFDDERLKAILVMSDGEANYNCQGTYGIAGAKQSAIDKACEAYENYGIVVHSVGFGPDADEQTLQQIASCGNGSYYSGDVSELVELYGQIAQDIIEASYEEQTIYATGNVSSILYPDSYIKINYERDIIPFGLLVTTEKDFSDDTNVYFDIPEDTPIVDATIVSYSGSKWTSKVLINNANYSSQNIFDLSSYGSNYLNFGDPYAINIPLNYISTGENNVKVFTGLSPAENFGGSVSNKIIYTLLKPALGYSPIVASASGCSWLVEFSDSTLLEVKVPQNYVGSRVCYYTHETKSYNENDAISSAVYSLFSNLDINGDGRIDTKFSNQDVVIDTNEVAGIPFVYSSEVEVRVWR